MPSRNAAHTALVKLIMLSLSARDDVFVQETPNGLFFIRAKAPFSREDRRIRIGISGQSDIRGEVTIRASDRTFGNIIVDCFPFYVEVKTGRAMLTRLQRNFLNQAFLRGARAGVARSVDDAHKIVDRDYSGPFLDD